MTWERFSTQANLVSSLVKQGIIFSEKVRRAILATDRTIYSPNHPYYDMPQSIECGQTISAPHMHASAMELAAETLIKQRELFGDEHDLSLLDVGFGSGYLLGASYRLLQALQQDSSENSSEIGMAQICGIEVYQDLYDNAKAALERDFEFTASHKPFELLSDVKNMEHDNSINIVVGDGWKGFNGGDVQFDVIHVGAAAHKLPQALVDQLKPGGRLIIPIGPTNGTQNFCFFDKAIEPLNGSYGIEKTVVTAVRYVPLVHVS